MKTKKYPLYPTKQYKDLREMIADKAAVYGDEIAFRYMLDRKTVAEHSYNDFYNDIRAGGNYLLKHNICGKHIAIMAENSYKWLVTYFSIITSGNIAVLVAKDSTPAEAVDLIAKSDVDIIVYSEQCQLHLDACKQKFGFKMRYVNIMLYDRFIKHGQRALDKGKNYYDKHVIDVNALCTIFFTSGSMGASKGVMISQNNILKDFIPCLSIVKIKRGTVMSVLPYTHAFGLIITLIVPFYSDLNIFICSSLSNFMREIPIAKPVLLGVVPLFVETFYKTIWRTAEKSGQAKTLKRGILASEAMMKVGIDKRREMFKSVLDKFGGNLELIVCGGAPLDEKYVKEFYAMGIQILNGYGITECSPVISCNRNEQWNEKSVGQILPTIQMRIDQPDEKGQGEIVVKGENVMLGYYNDPIATAEVLERSGWFHTGDLGYVDKDGFLFITGRKKSLIILSNGENVSPEEIEQYVGRINEVSEVVVYEDNHSITAEIFPDIDLGLTMEEFTSRIQKQIDKINKTLPNYKHIQKLILRDKEFEKTSTRKIKRYKATAKPEKSDKSDKAE